jgi:hypothetical protein
MHGPFAPGICLLDLPLRPNPNPNSWYAGSASTYMSASGIGDPLLESSRRRLIRPQECLSGILLKTMVSIFFEGFISCRRHPQPSSSMDAPESEGAPLSYLISGFSLIQEHAQLPRGSTRIRRNLERGPRGREASNGNALTTIYYQVVDCKI